MANGANELLLGGGGGIAAAYGRTRRMRSSTCSAACIDHIKVCRSGGVVD